MPTWCVNLCFCDNTTCTHVNKVCTCRETMSRGLGLIFTKLPCIARPHDYHCIRCDMPLVEMFFREIVLTCIAQEYEGTMSRHQRRHLSLIFK